MGVRSRNLLLGLVAAIGVRAGQKPSNPFDPNTTPYCTWWVDYNEAIPCEQVVEDEYVTSLADFVRWNPSVDAGCTNLKVGFSYCTEAYGEPDSGPGATTSLPETPTTTPTTTSPITTGATTTQPSGNGITTPEPWQSGMVDNCNKFYFVESGEDCAAVLKKNGISLADFVFFNPSVGEDCTSMWAETYVCVGAVGHTAAPTTTTPPTTTQPSGNGITTPEPWQPGMVDNCNKFYFVKSGEGCAAVLKENGISLADFVFFNPSVGETCSGMWAETYVCVGAIGHTATKPPVATPTNPAGWPSPIQTPIDQNCNKFYLVSSSSATCAAIVKSSGISLANFYKWNPSINSECTNLWLSYYVCTGVK